MRAQDRDLLHVAVFNVGLPVVDVELTYDGLSVYVITHDSVGRMWETHSGRSSLTSFEEILTAQLSRTAMMGVVVVNNLARTINGRGGNNKFSLTGYDPDVRCATFSGNGLVIATGDSTGRIRLWDAGEGVLTRTLHQPGVGVVAIKADAIGRRLLTYGTDRRVDLWDTSVATPIATTTPPSNSASTVALRHDGELFAVGIGANIELSNADGSTAFTLKDTNGTLLSLSFEPRGYRLISIAENGTMSLWDTESGTLLYRLEGTGRDAEFSGDGRIVVTWGSDSTAHVWETDNGRKVMTLSGHDDDILDATVDFDGMHIVTGSADGTARVWFLMNE